MHEDLIKDLKIKFKEHPGRLKHILGVYDKSIELAKHYNVDVYKSGLIALLHDYKKKDSLEEQEKYILKYGYTLPKLTNLYHGLSSSIYVKEELHIEDNEIIDSIRFHTTGYVNPSIYAKILMVSDITEESTRTDEISKEVRKLEFIDLDKALIKKLELTIDYLNSKNLPVDNLTVECLNSLRKGD